MSEKLTEKLQVLLDFRGGEPTKLGHFTRCFTK
jgi:hypothetical protein